MNPLIKALSKVELHIHIEGTLEPDLMFSLAKRNKISLPYKNRDELKAAYQFTNLQSFLNLYYAGTNVLQTEEDFYDLTWSYIEKIHPQNVRHTELFFDPQTHTSRDIPIGVVIQGIHQALIQAQKQYHISSELILCFLRDLFSKNALDTLENALKYQDKFIAVGLDSAERNHPPRDFVSVFDRARACGLFTVAHAGEEGPPSYIEEALDLLKVSRVDHGVRCLEDNGLTARLISEKMPLTVCPLSNVKLCVFKTLQDHPLKKMLNMGLQVTVNSDDPAYFSGYIEENYVAVAETLNLTDLELVQLARNSIHASFCSPERKKQLDTELDAVIQNKCC